MEQIDYKKKYEEAIERLKQWDREHRSGYSIKERDEFIFPELRESDDEKIRKDIISLVIKWWKDDGAVEPEFSTQNSMIAWLEKQGEQKPTVIIPKFRIGDYVKNVNDKREPIYEIVYMDKECYTCEYRGKENMGDKAVMHFAFDYPYLRHIQKSADKVEPKFKVGDWCIDNEDGTIFQIVKVLDNTYTYKTNEGKEYSCTHYSLENDARFWGIQDAKCGDVLCYKDEISLYKHDIKNCTKKETTFGGFVYHCCYDGKRFITDSLYSLTEQDKMDIHPATKEQRDALMKAMADAGYTFDFEKKELRKIEQAYDVGADAQKSVEWEPQTGDTFRKKGTTSPTYHLCDKREDGITFGFVENREVGISGGEITIFALRQDYELVERPKSIEDIVDEELNKSLQTKIEQKSTEWSEEDEEMHRKCICSMRASACGFPEEEKFVEQVDNWLKSLKDRVQPQPKQEWSKEDEDLINFVCSVLTNNFNENDTFDDENPCIGAIVDRLKSIKDRVQPKHREWSNEDERIKDNCISFLGFNKEYSPQAECIDECINWLKSLRPQSHWKPSESDILLLERIANGKSNPQEFQASLGGLIGQLKKLREE